jgi:hypothetical protein
MEHCTFEQNDRFGYMWQTNILSGLFMSAGRIKFGTLPLHSTFASVATVLDASMMWVLIRLRNVTILG